MAAIDVGRVVRVAESSGWDVAVYQHAQAEIAAGRGLAEDERAADWQYLLPSIRLGAALVLGCGLGTVPVALSRRFAEVHVVDIVPDRTRLLELRAVQHGIENVFPLCVQPGQALPFEDGRFDLVVARSEDWTLTVRHGRDRRAFEIAGRETHRLLAPGGTAYWTVGNRLGYPRLLRPWRAGAGVEHTLGGYRRMLAAAGFTDVRFYAPLPSHEGIPLFYLPIGEGAHFEYFFRHLFPLFETVSTEVKRLYGVEYRLAKIAVRAALRLGLARWAGRLSPGFGIIATRDGRAGAER